MACDTIENFKRRGNKKKKWQIRRIINISTWDFIVHLHCSSQQQNNYRWSMNIWSINVFDNRQSECDTHTHTPNKRRYEKSRFPWIDRHASYTISSQIIYAKQWANITRVLIYCSTKADYHEWQKNCFCCVFCYLTLLTLQPSLKVVHSILFTCNNSVHYSVVGAMQPNTRTYARINATSTILLPVQRPKIKRKIDRKQRWSSFYYLMIGSLCNFQNTNRIIKKYKNKIDKSESFMSC